MKHAIYMQEMKATIFNTLRSLPDMPCPEPVTATLRRHLDFSSKLAISVRVQMMTRAKELSWAKTLMENETYSTVAPSSEYTKPSRLRFLEAWKKDEM